jgi:hypothetical protein
VSYSYNSCEIKISYQYFSTTVSKVHTNHVLLNLPNANTIRGDLTSMNTDPNPNGTELGMEQEHDWCLVNERIHQNRKQKAFQHVTWSYILEYYVSAHSILLLVRILDDGRPTKGPYQCIFRAWLLKVKSHKNQPK